MIASDRDTNVSRRAFLAATGTAAGMLTLQPHALAGGDTKKMDRLTFVVVSDTHLGYRDQPSAARQFAKTAAEIAKTQGDFVLHLGDVVDGGREPQYDVYKKIRKTIGKPVHEIPGNHDPVKLFQKHIRKTIDTVVEKSWLRCLLLNNARTDSHDGFLSDKQLAWIEQQCREAGKDKARLMLCMHVPAHSNRHPDRGWYIKPKHGQKQLYEIVKRHRDRVLAMFHGHFHNGVRGWSDAAPVHEIIFPSALYNRDRKLKKNGAPGYNLPEFRPGFSVVTFDAGKMTLRYQPVGVKNSVNKVYPCRQLS